MEVGWARIWAIPLHTSMIGTFSFVKTLRGNPSSSTNKRLQKLGNNRIFDKGRI
jgi:hypothetical protein